MSTVAGLATSRSRTTTPTRAMRSTLLNRSSPSVPSAAHAFEPLAKSVLRHRLLYTIFAYSFLFSWIQTVLWLAWSRGMVGFSGLLVTPILPITLALTCANWAIGAVPAVVLRKVGLTAKRTAASSPSKILQTALSRRSTLWALLTYTLSATMLMIIHVWMASTFGNSRLTLFVRSKKHPYYLNGRFLFLLLSQVTLSQGFLLRNILFDRFVFRWSIASSTPVRKWPCRLLDLLKASFAVFLFTCICIYASGVTLAVARMLLPLLFKLPVLRFVLRPFTTHFLHGSWTVFLPMLHFRLVVRAFFLSLSTLSALEFAELLFDSVVAQPILVAETTADPFVTLVSGITSTEDYFRYFAYFELRNLAKDDSPAGSARRTAFFGDTRYTPSLWNQLVREGLLFLGRDYQLFLGKGYMPIQSAPRAAPPVVPSPVAPPGTPTHLIKKQIFKTAQQSPIHTVIDSLAADGTFSKAVEAGVSASHIPEIFRSVEGALQPVAAAPPTIVVTKNTAGLFKQLRDNAGGVFGRLLARYLPAHYLETSKRWIAWWRRERVNKKAEAYLPRREVDVLIIDVISRLTCASLTEDRYGVVQRDIPQILEAFISFLSAVEAYQAEIAALYKPPSPDEPLSPKELEERAQVREEVEKAGGVVAVVSEALKEGVMRIVRTFGDRLLAFKFPPRIARKLQEYVDYS